MSDRCLKKDYEHKIEIILSNRLQAGNSDAENQEHINNVKAWLCCEWQCNAIEEMKVYNTLVRGVEEKAREIISSF